MFVLKSCVKWIWHVSYILLILLIVAFIVKDFFKPTFIHFYSCWTNNKNSVWKGFNILIFLSKVFFFFVTVFSLFVWCFLQTFFCNDIDHLYISFIYTYPRGSPPIMITISHMMYDKPTMRCHGSYQES